MPKFERVIEAILFQSRWTLAPFYLGLAFCLLLMLFHFARELSHFVVTIPTATESDVILGVLALIDLTFTANLVLIVIFSGYENFVSKFEAGDHDRPDWMTKVDFGGLKQKLMTSIVAISAIQVLKAFMNIEQGGRAGQCEARLAGRYPCAVPGVAAGGRDRRPALRPWQAGRGKGSHRRAEVRRQGV